MNYLLELFLFNLSFRNKEPTFKKDGKQSFFKKYFLNIMKIDLMKI